VVLSQAIPCATTFKKAEKKKIKTDGIAVREEGMIIKL